MKLPPVRHVHWTSCYRAIPTRYPPVDLFERVAPPEDWEALAQLESLTNDRVRQEIGELSLLPSHERLVGKNATPVMAAFTHPGPSRFSDGAFGVYYASDTLETAVAEVAHHQGRFRAASHSPPAVLELRTYICGIAARFHDLRRGWVPAHDPDDYGPAQALGRILRDRGSKGLVFRSVRRPGHENVAAFWPSSLQPFSARLVTQLGANLRLKWDGHSISHYSVLKGHGDRGSWLPIPR